MINTHTGIGFFILIGLCVASLPIILWVSKERPPTEKAKFEEISLRDIKQPDPDERFKLVDQGTGEFEYRQGHNQAIFITSASKREISLTSPDGKTARLDFSGDSITYSGDLPVEESAKLFFEAYGNLIGECK